MLSQKAAAALNLSGSGSIRTLGLGSRRSAASLLRNVRFTVGDATFTAPRAVVLGLAEIEARAGRPIDGLLGYDLFQRCVVEIDYTAKTVSLYDPARYRYKGTGEALALTIRGNLPFVQARIIEAGRDPAFGRFIVDTGAGSAVILSASFVKEHRLPDAQHKTIARRSAGVGGEMDEFLGRVSGVRIGKFTVENPIVGFSQANTGVFGPGGAQGNVGGEILRRFKVVLDYRHRRLVLEPNAHIKDPDEYDMVGALLIADGPDLKTLKVLRVYPATPAAEAGLKDGDVVTAVDDKPASALNLDVLCDLFRQDGKEHLLAVERGKDTLKIKLRSRRLV